MLEWMVENWTANLSQDISIGKLPTKLLRKTFQTKILMKTIQIRAMEIELQMIARIKSFIPVTKL